MTTEIVATVPESARGDEIGRHDDASMCWVQGLPHGVTLTVEMVPRKHSAMSPRVVARVSAADEYGRRVVTSVLHGDECGIVQPANRSIGSYAAWVLGDSGYELAGANWGYLMGAVAAILGRPGYGFTHYRWKRD